MADMIGVTGEESIPSGTGTRIAGAAITVAGVAALVAALISFFSIWLQLKSKLLPSKLPIQPGAKLS